jgi:hypothetical protein
MEVSIRGPKPRVVIAYGRVAHFDSDFVTIILSHQEGLQQPTLLTMSGEKKYGRRAVHITEAIGRKLASDKSVESVNEGSDEMAVA